MVKSAYIHIPFCNKICSYCDFSKMYFNEEWVNKYLDCLEKEIKDNYKNEILKTIYIGGGTPSVLKDYQLDKLFNILCILNKDNCLEYTIEVNPEDIIESKIELFKKYGINRISIGIQTFNKKYLKLLNRDNEYEDIKNKIKLLRKNGFDNINIDLIYAIENETIEELEEDIDKFISLDIDHISCYSIQIEENTKLYIDNVKNIDDLLDYEMYLRIEEKLKQNGFNHYEISNYSKGNKDSKHNLTYWNNEEYYGFGLSASGYIDNIRYTNTKNFNKYLNNNEKEIVNLSINDIIEYEMILGLRKFDGVNKNTFYNKYKKNIKDSFNIKHLLEDKKLIEDDNSIYINPKYMYVSNDILVNFVGGYNE